MLVGILASLLPLYGIAFSQESAQSAPAAGVATPDSRLACPPDAKVDKDVKLIRAAYEAAYDQAKDTGEPDSLIQQLVGLSNETPDPAKKYALLLEAEAVATQYENYATALDLLAKRAEKFQIDGLKLKGQLLKRLAGPKVAADLVLFDQATDTAEHAMQTERFDVAAETASLALSVARAVDREQKVEARKRGRPVGKAGKAEAGPTPVGPGLVKKAAALQSQVTAAQKLFAEYGEALADIKSQPDDAAANSVVAQYLCFVRGDWQRGLPALAKSDIDRLKKVAADEISILTAENRDPKRVFELAGAWWAASDSKDLTDDQQAAVKDHAAGFYAEVAENLSDVLEKKLAQSRLRGLETKAPNRANQPTIFDFSRPNQLAKFTVGGVMRETSKGLEFPGRGSSWVDSRQSFAGPLEAAFVASTFPDINLDCYVGIFSSQPLTSFVQSGIHLHWGCFSNTRTLLYVFGKIREIRHRPIEAGRDYTITLRVDKKRQLTVLIDELIIHQEVLPSDIKLVGSIRCGGGIGHVLYRSATVVTGQVQSGNTPTLPPEAAITPSKAILATDPLVNSVRMKLKLLPAGTFMMGDADGRDAEQPPHQVTIRRPFYLGIHEVTNAQWRRVMGQVPSDSKDEAHPVEKVSWHDAVLFCRKLSDMPTERNLGHVYRLPTEAEWEYACRAGTTTKYSFGNDAKLLGDYAWFAIDGNSTTPSNPVGQKRPNPWGLFDMHGNVWEWCSDWYGDYDSHAVTDPQGPTDGTHRARRGGGWYVSASGCFSSLRTFEDPTRSNNFHGFRVAMTVAESSSARTPAAVVKP
jgi:formylglycine-generating enzyme required for sulfatase activity